MQRTEAKGAATRQDFEQGSDKAKADTLNVQAIRCKRGDTRDTAMGFV